MRIAVANSAKSKTWKNVSMSWDALIERLKEPRVFPFTLEEYLAYPKPKQAEIKDVGGYVGGYLKNGKRKTENVVSRAILTLDIDNKPSNNLLTVLENMKVLSFVHTTFKSSSEKPRYRIIVCLDEEVTPTQYEAIARLFALRVGIEQFDPTTFQPHRLMYWPAKPSDTVFDSFLFTGSPLDTKEYLCYYLDYADSSEWPTHKAEKEEIIRAVQKQQDPTEKAGIVGAFCRTYTITEAIAEFLSDVYDPTETDNRYTYKAGETAAGLIVYEDKYAYSHHGTDPVSGKLCNAFDLVRVHRFGNLDEKQPSDKAVTQLPSYKAMIEFASSVGPVTTTLLDERRERVIDFEDDEPLPEDEEQDDSWKEKLTTNKQGVVDSTTQNITLILRSDPKLKDRLRYNEFDQQSYVFGSLPWRKVENPELFEDVDYAGVRSYLETYYGITGKQKIDDSLALEFFRNRYHPVKEYFSRLEWDGVERLDNLLIKYFAAPDTRFSRLTIRKCLTAAVARIYNPGTKFDYMLILVGGKQGEGKSKFCEALCSEDLRWFQDNFTVSSKENKMEEQIRGALITEMPEMTGFSKADVNAIKSFLTRTSDSYRPAFGKVRVTYQRQGIFIGTTNDLEFLKDPTGNRRYWPVDVDKSKAQSDVYKMEKSEVDQIWAEAIQRYKQGERLYLLPDEEAEAEKEQAAHTIRDGRKGIIDKYLNMLLPSDWDKRDVFERREYIANGVESGTEQRQYVCALEIWCECFGKPREDVELRYKTREINDIMRANTLWVARNTTRDFGIYGIQKYYERKL